MLPKTGVDSSFLHSYLKLAAWVVPLAAVLGWGYYRLLAKTSRPAGDDARPSVVRRRAGVAWLLLVAAGLGYFAGAAYYLAHRKQVFAYLLKSREQTTLYDDHYRAVRPEDVTFRRRRNVILLVLESIEETFNDGRVFGEPLMPGLKKLREGNGSFYGMEDTRGATMTIGGLTAFIFGLPLAFSNGSSMASAYGEKSKAFMPGAWSILEAFERHGYEIDFILGADRRYSGKDKLFGTHSRANIFDWNFFHQQELDGRMRFERWNWGAPDPVVYGEAKERLSGKTPDRPFMMVIETTETHSSGDTWNGLRPPKWGDMRDPIAETDLDASDFVTWAEKQPFAADTTIIVLGDHLWMQDEVGPVDLPDRNRREIYNVFINPARPVPADRGSRPFASFDLAPTILEAAGAELPEGRFGLGVSLFELGRKTLFEEKGRAWYDQEIRKRSALYDSLLLPQALKAQ
jgi:phosphoglycerol transferase